MTVKTYLGERYDYTHENQAFDQLCQLAKAAWAESDDLYFVIGNVTCNGHELDALLIKQDAIVVIDFKNYGGEVVFSENGPWRADDIEVKGGVKVNPYKQIHGNKFALLNWLKEKLPDIASEHNFGHISGLVLFQKSIQFERNKLPAKISTWFNIGDFLSGMDWLRHLASSQINLSKKEQQSIITALNVPEYRLSGAAETANVAIDGGDGKDNGEFYIEPNWTSNQKEAIQLFDNFLRDDSPEQVLLLTGMVLTGKSTLAEHFGKSEKYRGKKIIFLAPNATLSQELTHNTGIEFKSLYSHIYIQSQEEANNDDGVYEHPLRKCEDDPEAIYIVDEAQLLSDSYWQMDDSRFGSGHTLTDFFQFVRIEKKPKTRFVIIGDPYQIMQGSSFVEATSYINKGLSLVEKELTEAIVDVKKNPIAMLAIKIIKSIKAKSFNSLFINTNDDQLVVLESESERRKPYYAEIFSAPYRNGIFVSFSNERVHTVNQWGRKVFLGRTSSLPQTGDMLELKNKITTGNELDSYDSYPGTYFEAQSDCSASIVRSINLKGRSQETSIRFREVPVSYFKPRRISTDKILFLEEFLLSDKPELDTDAILALKILAKQNFKNDSQYRLLKEESDQLKERYSQSKSAEDKEKYKEATKKLAKREREWLKLDPYLNAARLRYAYSTTCHQAQGRKWDTVLVDASYNGQGRDNENYFRWLYTAITRAKHRVVLDKFKPITPWDRLQIRSSRTVITPAVKSLFNLLYPKERELTSSELKLPLPEGFSKTDLALLNLFFFTGELLEKKNIKIVSVKQHAYQEQYTVESQHGERAVLVFHYNGKFDVTNLRLQETGSDVGRLALSTLQGSIRFEEQLANDVYLLIAPAFARADLSVEGGQSRNWLLMLTLSNSTQQRAIVHVHFNQLGCPSTIEVEKATSQEIVEQINQAFATNKELEP